MKPFRVVLLLLLISLLASFIPAKAQTPPAVYQCPDLAREGQTAHLGSECPTWVWTAPRADYLIASCGATSCSWNSNVRWRRVSAVTATSAISACTGTVSGRNCSREAWVRKDAAFPDVPPPPPPPPPPVDCVVGQYGDWQLGEFGACRNRTHARTDIRTRTVTTQPSNGGAACPALTETRTVDEACSLSPPCFPQSKTDVDLHVAWEPLSLANWSVKYQAKAVWYCASPTGPVRQAWVFGLDTVTRNARRQLDGVLNWNDVRDLCESSCEVLADGPLKDELAAYADGFTVEQLGTLP